MKGYQYSYTKDPGREPFQTRFATQSHAYFDLLNIVPRWGNFIRVPYTQVPRNLGSVFTLVSRQLSRGEGDSVIPLCITETDPHSVRPLARGRVNEVYIESKTLNVRPPPPA